VGQDQETKQERPLPPSAPSPASGGREALIGWALAHRLWLFGVPLGRGEDAEEKARRVAGRRPASSLSGHGWPVSEPPQRPRAVGRQADRARGGALLFGYFLLGKQEKVTRAQGCAWNPQGRGSVFAKSTKTMHPGFRRDDDVGKWTHTKTEHHPHPTLPLKGRAKEKRTKDIFDTTLPMHTLHAQTKRASQWATKSN